MLNLSTLMDIELGSGKVNNGIQWRKIFSYEQWDAVTPILLLRKAVKPPSPFLNCTNEPMMKGTDLFFRIPPENIVHSMGFSP